MEKHFEDLHSYKYLDGSTNRYTDLACSCDESSVEGELKTREEYLYLSVLLIRKPGVVLPIMAYIGRLRPKGVPFSGFRYLKG